MAHFDCWASRFGETVTALELAPEGTGYRARTRFSKFFNLPELMNLFKEIADIKTADQLHLPTPEVEYHNIVAQPTEHQKEMVKALSERAANGCWPFVSDGRASDPHSHASDCVSCHAVKRIYPAYWRNAALSGSRSHCPCLSYGNTPAGKRDGDLSPYFRSSRSYGRKPDARRFAPYFAACLCRFAASDRCRICRRIRCGSKKAILLKGKTYETID